MSGSFQWKPRVFVVMPFGVKEVPKCPKVEPAGTDSQPQEKIEVDFNAVYSKLLAPALKKIGCEPFRADQESGAGEIRKDMFFELITADVVLADISILNANVFYELGIRHAAGPRGVLTVHAGWSDRPFDVAPDRTFRYDGKLFVQGARGNKQKLSLAVASLAQVLENAMTEDEQKTGSPVYSLIDGLKPVDFSQIKMDRARYFGAVHEEWRKKVMIARKQQNAGDILTLAEDMPTRLHRKALLWECARALVALHRFESACGILDELLEIDRDHFAARCLLELVQNRLGFRDRAEVNLRALVTEREGNADAQGMLGRVYKDIWRSAWENEPDLTKRRELAGSNDILLRNAIKSYRAGFESDLDNYYNGINFLTLVCMSRDLGLNVDPPITDAEVQDVFATIRMACKREVRRQPNDIWALATLGEISLLQGKVEDAVTHYNRASRAPDISYFEIDSMLTQIRLFERLGFTAGLIQPVIDFLTARAQQFGNPKSQYEKVVVCSGHMIDKPKRPKRRFPPNLEKAVREQIAARLEECKIGKRDIALCGGACGADILFAEECVKRGAQLRLMIPLPREEFIEESVSFAGSQWVQRLNALMDDTAQCKVAFQHERIGKPPAGGDVFARNNIWQVNTARALNVSPSNIFAILVWDEQPAGDGPGGTSDFASRMRSLGGVVHIINPIELETHEQKRTQVIQGKTQNSKKRPAKAAVLRRRRHSRDHLH